MFTPRAKITRITPRGEELFSGPAAQAGVPPGAHAGLLQDGRNVVPTLRGDTSSGPIHRVPAPHAVQDRAGHIARFGLSDDLGLGLSDDLGRFQPSGHAPSHTQITRSARFG